MGGAAVLAALGCIDHVCALEMYSWARLNKASLELGRFARHCEERKRRSNPSFFPRRYGLLTWGMCVSRMGSHLFVRLRPPLRPDRGVCRMTRADQVKAGPLGPPRSGLALS